ncbi:MAG: FAD:protein FMN transferase [Candidatus Omnitrophica bacterium]|nr:FAD:protein FMN transferase [Candidatus Omnitrophota bacterium]
MVKKIILLGLICMYTWACKDFAAPVYRDKFVAAGTVISVVSPYKEAGSLVAGEFKRLDGILNGYLSGSDLYRVNHSHNQPIKVAPELIELMKLAKNAYTLTQGYFDVSKGNLYQFWKSKINNKEIIQFPGAEEIDKAKNAGGIDRIVIDEQNNTLMLTGEGMSIDVGGIAKGYMVDKAVQRLKKEGIDSALINAGGDLYCLGRNFKRLWQVGIKDPRETEGVIIPLFLYDESVATSGSYEQFFRYNGKRFSHLIDPRTGMPVENNILSVSVVAGNATTADSLATAFFVMGIENVRTFLAGQLSTLEIYIVAQTEKGPEIYVFR